MEALSNRWFAGRPIVAELSPVTDFREACCRSGLACARAGLGWGWDEAHRQRRVRAVM